MALYGHSLCLGLAISYVLVLYAVPSAIAKLPRNNPTHIMWRLAVINIMTIVVMIFSGHCSIFKLLLPSSYLEVVGLRLDSLVPSICASILLMIIFYAGPLTVFIAHVMTESKFAISRSGRLQVRPQSNSVLSTISNQLSRLYSTIELFRNLIFAPITEELIFRSLMVPILYSTHCSSSHSVTINFDDVPLSTPGMSGHGLNPFYLCFICPLWFGVAHCHHFIEKIRKDGMSWKSALISSIVQFSYTYIFGGIAVWFFVRTGNIAAPITSHVICNLIGLPDISFVTQPGDGLASSPLSYLYPYRNLLLLLHAAGLVLFVCLFNPLTSALAQHSIYYNSHALM